MLKVVTEYNVDLAHSFHLLFCEQLAYGILVFASQILKAVDSQQSLKELILNIRINDSGRVLFLSEKSESLFVD